MLTPQNGWPPIDKRRSPIPVRSLIWLLVNGYSFHAAKIYSRWKVTIFHGPKHPALGANMVNIVI